MARCTEYEPSDPDFPLYVDLGPEPSLTEGLSRPKPRSAVDQSAPPSSAMTSAKRLTPLWLWGSGALTTTIVIVVGVLAVIKPFSTTPEGTGAGPVKIKSNASSKTKRQLEPPITVRN